jgi:serine/threonine protein kinase
VKLGAYELTKRIGFGGMGEVFLTTSGVVVKRLMPHLAADPEFVSLFLEEARIAARLHHPNIVQILELGEADGTLYLAMEYVDGPDLRRLKAVNDSQAVHIAEQVARGLDHAHKARDSQGRLLKVVHRDVSPHNVLVAKDGTAKLIDFGVARAAGGGKVAYMAPEQADTDEADARSDQFSLGVVLWELLCGRRLFDTGDEVSTLERVIACRIDPPPILGSVVMRALQKDPRKRYRDCFEFAEALKEARTELKSA